MKSKNEKTQLVLLSLLGIVLFFGTWEMCIQCGLVSERVMCAPSTAIKTFITKLTVSKPDGATVIVHFLTSLKLSLAGFLTAVIIGVPLGLFMGYFRIMDSLLTPLFEIVRPIPPIAWIPIVILTLGIGFPAKVFIIFISAFVPCVINSYLGIKLTNQTLINVAKTFGASEWQIFTKVCVPSSMSMVFAGVRISLGNAWSTLVAAEMLASTKGLGYMIQMGRTLIRPDIIVVGMATIGCTGALMAWILGRFEKKVAPWRYK
ncbi:ABC transporter permease [Clostridium sp. AM58-1XD]|uniref:ABC transporter permease n=1 Tax=Clostridium sp. AM58-1XD TaxID=2292307 RepID=UPI001FA8317C|nr:ABC transporter permease [Clostridium sp. AM58-1XD]